MRALLLVLIVAGCAGSEESTLCDDLRDSQSGCMNEDNYAECRAAVRRCGDDVLMLESCPLQFDCP